MKLEHRFQTWPNSSQSLSIHKWMGWEQTVSRDKETGHIVNKIDMPNVPGVSQVLETAEAFYKFINAK